MNKIAFIDFEMNTNGDMNKNNLEIIEIGIIIADKNKITNSYHSVVRPISTDKIYEYTTFLTGIETKDIKKSITIHRAMEILHTISNECDSIYCWGDVDCNCLIDCLKKAKHVFKKEDWETIKKIKNLQESSIISHKLKQKGLHEWAQDIGLIDGRQKIIHRALPDAILLYELYKHEKRTSI